MSTKIEQTSLNRRLEKIQDLVLFRYGSTGTQECVKRAFESLGLIAVFPVKSINNYTCGGDGNTVFRDCILVKPGTTFKQVSEMVLGGHSFQYIETLGGVRV